jgi:glycosyltransferase involved in cell wall biosynthesis
MKILLLTATYPPSVNGVAVSVSNLFSAFKRMGHEVIVLAPDDGTGGSAQKGEVKYPSITNPLIEDYPIPLLPITPKIIKLLSKKKFDIVHAHHPFHIAFFADIVSSINNIPLVFTYHTRYDEYAKIYMKFLPKKISKRIASYTAHRACRRANVLIAPSKFISKELKSRFPDKRIKVIPTGLTKMQAPKIPIRTLRKKFHLPTRKIILLSVSRLAKEKNLNLLIQSFRLLPKNYHLLIVGSGIQETELRQSVHNLNLNDRVTFAGKIAHSEIAAFYHLSDIFLLSSLTETQGLTFLEALYFGLPIVVVDSEVNREWLPAGSGLLVKNDPKEFSKAILEVKTWNREEVSEIAKKRASGYTIENTVKDMINAYQEASVDKKDQRLRKSKIKLLKNLLK